MKFSAQLDVAMVAHETTDEVTVMLDLVAPAAAVTEQPRTPSTLQIVLDRSGSMAGERLAGALDALERLVARLDASDNFGVVVFDNHAAVAVPAGPLHDKQHVVEQLRRIRPGGSTDLSSGYLRGLQELRRVAGESGGTLLVISDGHVNSGVTDPARFAEIAATARRQQVVTSTLGLGLGYDESLLVTLADAGSGNHHFAEGRDQAGALIASEVDHLLDKAVQAASLVVELSPEVQLLRLYNDLPAQQVGDGQIMVELGDLYAEETPTAAAAAVGARDGRARAGAGRHPAAALRRAARSRRAGRHPAGHGQRRARRPGGGAGGEPGGAQRGALPGGAAGQEGGLGVAARR